MKSFILILFIFFFIYNPAQNDSISDEGQKKKIYSTARKASIMSACLPGLGQAYNKKYWKIPVLYAGLGAFAYIFQVNNVAYKYYRKNLIAENDSDPETKNISGYGTEELKVQKQEFSRKRDLGLIGIGALYLINIIDANVDAHLKTFDVSDDLGLQLKPFNNIYSTGNGIGYSTGISVKLIF